MTQDAQFNNMLTLQPKSVIVSDQTSATMGKKAALRERGKKSKGGHSNAACVSSWGFSRRFPTKESKSGVDVHR
jgi:hypothetical protein